MGTSEFLINVMVPTVIETVNNEGKFYLDVYMMEFSINIPVNVFRQTTLTRLINMISFP